VQPELHQQGDKVMTTVTQKIIETATVANAKEYFATPDQFVFCLNLLELSLEDDGDRFCDKAVNRLEDIFEQIEEVCGCSEHWTK